MNENSTGLLTGIRIRDLTTVIMGPYATQLLADLGARVTKVEPPEGDMIRHVGPMLNPAMGHMYLHAGRNKDSSATLCPTDYFRLTADWLEQLGSVDIPCMPMHSPASLMNDPHWHDKKLFLEVDHPTEGNIT